MDASTTVTISTDDSEDTLELPAGIVDVFAGEDQSGAEAIGDLILVDMTHRLHGLVAHGEGTPEPELVDLEAAVQEQFEERFGASFAELTGHSH